jgi:hypothetical protein
MIPRAELDGAVKTQSGIDRSELIGARCASGEHFD